MGNVSNTESNPAAIDATTQCPTSSADDLSAAAIDRTALAGVEVQPLEADARLLRGVYGVNNQRDVREQVQHHRGGVA